MRDTLIGITTITLLFGIVWLSQSKVNTNKSIASKPENTIIEESYENIKNELDTNEEDYSEKLFHLEDTSAQFLVQRYL